MSIVIITTKEHTKSNFINKLHLATNKGVKLVIITKPKKQNPLKRLKSLYWQTGFIGFVLELWYALIIRLDQRTRNRLDYFKYYTHKNGRSTSIPKVIEVDDINSPNTHNLLLKISPYLMVVWNTGIIHNDILKTAEKAINLHMGICPNYRGAAANQFAVYQGDFSNIGSTIHYVDDTVDGGSIIKITKGNTKKTPQDLFRELNDKSQESFLSVAVDIFHRKKINSLPQDMTIGRNFRLKHWTPSVRYKTAQKIKRWEERHSIEKSRQY